MRSAYYITAVFSTAAIPFFANIFLARQLHQDEYALFSLLYSFIGFAGAIGLAGQPTAFTAVYFSSDRRDFGIRAVKTKASRVVIGGLIVVSFLWLALWSIKFHPTVSSTLFISVFLFISAKAFFDFFNTIVNCIDHYQAYAIATTFSGVLIFAGLVTNPTVLTYFYIGSIGYGIAAIFLNTKIRIILHADHREDYPIRTRSLFNMGWIAVPGMLVSSGLTFGERSLINLFLESGDLAIYAVATTIAVNGARVFVTAIIKPGLISLLKALQENDHDTINFHVQRMTIMLFFTLTTFILVVSLTGESAFTRLFSLHYAPSFRLLIPLFSISVLEGMSMIFSQPLIQKGKLKTIVSIGVIATAFNLLLNFILIPHLGLNALVVSFATSTSFMMLVNYSFARRAGSKLAFPYIYFALILILNISYFLWF